MQTRRSKRAREMQVNGSTSTVMAALNGASNPQAEVVVEKHESIAKEIAQIVALEAELAALDSNDVKLVASLMAVLQEETEQLNQSAEKRYG